MELGAAGVKVRLEQVSCIKLTESSFCWSRNLEKCARCLKIQVELTCQQVEGGRWWHDNPGQGPAPGNCEWIWNGIYGDYSRPACLGSVRRKNNNRSPWVLSAGHLAGKIFKGGLMKHIFKVRTNNLCRKDLQIKQLLRCRQTGREVWPLWFVKVATVSVLQWSSS